MDNKGSPMLIRILRGCIFVFFLTTNLVGNMALASPDDAPVWRGQKRHDHVYLEAAEKEKAAKKMLNEKIVATPNQELYDVQHYFLDLTLNTTGFTGTLTGTVTTTAEVIGDSISQMDFNMIVNLITLDTTAGGNPTSFSKLADILTVQLDRTYYAGETVSVGIHYTTDFRNINFTNHFELSSHNSQEMIYTYSEPYGASEWWPCKDLNTDKADSLDLRINVAEGLVVASNGRLVTDFNFGSWHRYYWRTSYPISTYLVSLAIYPYETYSDWYKPQAGGASMEVAFYVFPDHMDSVQTNYAQTVPMIDAFASVFGEYPFLDDKYGHAEFTAGGGMEHQTISSMGNWTEDLIAHELSHQWWGNMVTCADFSHIWLNEGLAMWSEAYWKEQRYGFGVYKSHMQGITHFGPGTVIVEDPATEDIFDVGLTYFKAGWVIHMLRGVLGDTDFFAGLAQYRANHEYSSATTADLQAAMETASGRDLETFFQQWIYDEYFPIYRMDWVPGPGANEITVTIDQIQTEGGLFTMPVPLRIVTDVSTTDLKVENNQLSQQFVLPVDGSVQSVNLDPDRWILSPYPIQDATFNQGVLLVNGVHWDHYDANYDMEVTNAYEARAFWGDTPISFWDTFAEPLTGYPSTLPALLGHGAVPAEILKNFSTVIWVGNAYNGDLYEWLDTPIRQYLEAGGNVLLMTRFSHEFLFTGLGIYLGVELAETGSGVGHVDCTALAPGLVDIPLFSQQTYIDLFAEAVGPHTTALFKDNVRHPSRITSAMVTPPFGGAYRPDGGRFALIGGRPYRMDPAALSTNVEYILANHFNEPYAPSPVPNDQGSTVPNRSKIGAPYPNPFNPSTKVPFSLANDGEISLDVYDIRGHLVRHLAGGKYPRGSHAVVWDGADNSGKGVASGTYLLRLRDSQGVVSKSEMVLVR